MMEFENIQIQLIDTPPLAPQAIEVWMAGLLRRADALLVLVDLSSDPLAQTEAVIAELAGMRIGIIDQKTEGEPPVIRHQTKALVAGNKIDLPGAGENYAALQKKYGDQLPVLAISVREGTGLEEMKHGLYRLLDVIRVYTKVPGERPDMHEPLVLARGSTIEDAAYTLHKDLLAKLKFARVWGSGKHDGMMVKRGHILQDGDIIELHVG
jgi:ribosome-interacting GTPase 1